MDKESKDIVRDDCMAIAKEPKNGIQQNTPSNHNLKISKAIKEVTSQHSKLLKKLVS